MAGAAELLANELTNSAVTQFNNGVLEDAVQDIIDVSTDRIGKYALVCRLTLLLIFSWGERSERGGRLLRKERGDIVLILPSSSFLAN